MSLFVLFIICLLAPAASAHHIMGIPHYAYDEQYPQTPVLTYRVEAGPYDVKMTGYPRQAPAGGTLYAASLYPTAGQRCAVRP